MIIIGHFFIFTEKYGGFLSTNRNTYYITVKLIISTIRLFSTRWNPPRTIGTQMSNPDWVTNAR